MEHVNCPQCGKRLRVPRSDKAASLRCPACKHVFEVPPSKPAAPAESIPPMAANEVLNSHAEVKGGNATILSAADEAMLRDFGSGSGLLELTRETYGAMDVRSDDAPAPAMGTIVGPKSTGSAEFDRQFQIVTTALTLANKLVSAHKNELVHARKSARLGWIVTAAVVVLSFAVFGWGMLQYSSAVNLPGLKTNLVEKQADLTAKQAELLAAQNDFRKDKQDRETELKLTRDDLRKLQEEHRVLQGNLGTAKEDLAKANASVQMLTGNLEKASQKNDKLLADLERAKASQPTTLPAVTSAN